MELDRIPGGDRLPLRVDGRRVLDPAPNQVLEELIGVEAAASLSQLGDPRPDGVGRGVHRDCVQELPAWTRHERVARKRAAHLFIGGPPSHAAAAVEGRGERPGDPSGASHVLEHALADPAQLPPPEASTIR
jgi:hypothetical protein